MNKPNVPTFYNWNDNNSKAKAKDREGAATNGDSSEENDYRWTVKEKI